MVAKFDLNDDNVVVVIGTGAGGGVLSNELAQKGVKVVALEAGGRYLPIPVTLRTTDSGNICVLHDMKVCCCSGRCSTTSSGRWSLSTDPSDASHHG